MAASVAHEALIASFFFGILVNIALAGLVIYVRGHGSTLFRDGLRLALIVFLGTAAAWGLVGFLSTLIDPSALSTCQVAVVFSTLLDQFARTAIEQYLVWAACKERTATGRIPQLLIVVRFIVGMVFVGESRPQFNPTCVPLSNLIPLAITLVAVDAFILVNIAAVTLSSASELNSQGSNASSIILVTILGLAVWMGTSVTLLLGLDTLSLFFRTTLPTIGMFISVAIVIVLSGALPTSDQGRRAMTPPSPTPQIVNRDRELASADSNYPPSRYEDVKDMRDLGVTQYSENELSRIDNALPVIKRPVTGVAGIGGVPVQGELFPPVKMNTDIVANFVQTDIRTRIDLPVRKKSSKRKGSVEKLQISAPTPIDTPAMQEPFSKIPTVDLETAAKAEKQRQVVNAENRVYTTLIATRRAPQPPTGPERGLRITMSTRRRDVKEDPMVPNPPAVPVPFSRADSTKTTTSTEDLSLQGNASSTSAQVNPDNETLRRRSPRRVLPSKFSVSTADKSPTRIDPVTPGQVVQIPIPRPPADPDRSKSPEPAKTPLQRRPTNGLPSNPRAQFMKKAEAGDTDHQGIMFVNNIEYNNPTVVYNVPVGGAKTPQGALNSGNSVLHRPRPIPRKTTEDRQVFPCEDSPLGGHGRSKSASSINRRSGLRDPLGSPTQLPPLPPPPRSAGSNVSRPQPNSTNSMTFDEKISMFYPPEPATGSGLPIPDLPLIPPMYAQPNKPQRPSVADRNTASTSVTDTTSIRTQSILGADEDSGDSKRNPADELGNSWLPGMAPPDGVVGTPKKVNDKRQSSPIIPAMRYSAASEMSSEMSPYGETTAGWVSVHSPVAPVSVQGGRLDIRTTYIKDPRQQSVLSGFGDEVMTVMLDTSSEHSYADEDRTPVPPEIPQKSARRASGVISSSWHRRVGDDLPSFSERKEKTRSRKMPPPPPLLLNGSSNKAFAVPEAELPPMETPSRAYGLIQDQLRMLDEPAGAEGQRELLLEDLEAEMNQQESRWQGMQHNMGRDSVSTTGTDSRPASYAMNETTILRSSSLRSMLAERRANRRNTQLSNAGNLTQDTETVSSSGSSENSRASFWQSRLAQAQVEYMENAPAMIQKRKNLNFLSVTRPSAQASMGSPTPPDTDESEPEIGGQLDALMPMVREAKIHQLWQAASPKKESRGALWVAPVHMPVTVDTVELPGLSVRPAARKSAKPLSIDASGLWEKPEAIRPHTSHGLWANAMPTQPIQTELEEPKQKEPEQSSKVSTRPLTQRPPRKAKRVTLLPDILESPQPLPDKRGTLGIFQFPWGEKSEHPTIQPRTGAFMPIPGTMSSGGPRVSSALEARARELEAEEYSSSFFDDYDEDAGDNFEDSDNDSGDDFDETTLWEIASLLKSEQVPSKNSLLPGRSNTSVYDDYITEEPSDIESDDEDIAGFNFASEDIDFELPGSRQNTARASLWIADTNPQSARQSFGIAQPEDDAWEGYIPIDIDIARSHPRREEEAATIESSQLWGTDPLAVPEEPVCEVEAVPEVPSITPISRETTRASLWAVDTGSSPQSFGLPQPEADVWASYISSDIDAVKPQSRKIEEIAVIQSRQLWMPASQRTAAKPSLWKAAATHRDHSFGLPQPDLDIWNMYVPGVTSPVRSAPRITGVPSIESNSLWTAPAKPATSNAALLWASSKPAQQEVISVTPSLLRKASKGSLRLQSSRAPKKTSPREPKPNAAFDFMAARANLRKTYINLAEPDPEEEQAPAALAMATPESTPVHEPVAVEKPVAIEAPIAVEESVPVDVPFALEQPLAVEQPVVIEEIVAAQPLTTNGEGLWKSTPASPQATSVGLFQVGSQRKDYSHSMVEPVALRMATPPRRVETPLPQLESTQLWSVGETTGQVDWITLSSVPPQSPSIASTRSSWSSPTSETSSIRSTSTKASTVGASLRGVSTRGSFGRSKKDAPGEPALGLQFPDIPEIPEIPESPASLHPRNLDEERPQHYDFLEIPEGERATEVIAKDFDEPQPLELVVPSPGQPSFVPLRQQYRSTTVSQGDWDFALQEAISASYPASHFTRTHASEAQWDEALQEAINNGRATIKIERRAASPTDSSAALNEAILAGYPQLNRLSRGQIPGSQWEAQLREAIARSTRQTQTTTFDVSTRHPVFFGSLTTTIEDVHPAMMGYEQPQNQTQPQTTIFDVCTRHPVFFGSLATSIEDFHPAMTGYEQSQNQTQTQTPVLDVATRHPVFFGSLTTSIVDFHPAMIGYEQPAPSVQRLRVSLQGTPAPSSSPITGAMWAPSALPAAMPAALGIEQMPDTTTRHPRVSPEMVDDFDPTDQEMWKDGDGNASETQRGYGRDWLRAP